MTEYRYFREQTDEDPLEYRVGLRYGAPVELRTRADEWVQSSFEDVDDLLDERQTWPFGFEEVESL